LATGTSLAAEEELEHSKPTNAMTQIDEEFTLSRKGSMHSAITTLKRR